MNHHELVLFGELHHLDEEVLLHAHRGRIVREGQDEHLGLGPGKTGRLLQAGEEVLARHQGHRAQVAVGDDDRIGVDGIGRVRHQHPVPRLEDRQGQVGHALLGADGGDGLGLGIQLDLVMVPIPGRDGLAEPRDSP